MSFRNASRDDWSELTELLRVKFEEFRSCAWERSPLVPVTFPLPHVVFPVPDAEFWNVNLNVSTRFPSEMSTYDFATVVKSIMGHDFIVIAVHQLLLDLPNGKTPIWQFEFVINPEVLSID